MIAVNDRILIQKGIIPDRMQSGIYVPAGVSTDAKVKLNVGRVISKGPGIRFHDGYTVKPECDEGDIVMWEQFGDIQAEVLGEGVVCVRWEDVIAKLSPDEVKNWIFDPKEYKLKLEEQNRILEETRKKQLEEESEASQKRVVRSCRSKDCIYVNKPVDNKEQCEYCGSFMVEVEGHVAPSIWVNGGASPARV